MKITNLIGTAILLAMFAVNFTACSDDDPVPPEKPEVPEVPEKPVTPEIAVPDGAVDVFQKGLSFDVNAGEKEFSFSTNVDWSIAVAETRGNTDWCSVSPASGKAGKHTVKVKASANDSFDDRRVSLTVKAGDLKKSVAVSQKQKDALTLTSDKFEVGTEGGTIEVEVKANVDFEVEIAADAKGWISEAKKSRGLTASKLAFDIAASNEMKARQGDIVIKSGKLSETIHVFQAGNEKTLLLSKSEATVSHKGETVEVTVKSNFDYAVKMPAVDWVTEAKGTRAMSSHTLYFDVKPNHTGDGRTAEIVFFDKDSDISSTLVINQLPTGVILVSEKNVNVKAEGQTFNVIVKSNIDYEVAISDNWITQASSRALNEKNFSFVVKANDTEGARKGKVVFINKQEAVADTVVVYQDGNTGQQTEKKLVEVRMMDSYGHGGITFNYNNEGKLTQAVYTFNEDGYLTNEKYEFVWSADKVVCYCDFYETPAVFTLENGLVKTRSVKDIYEKTDTKFFYNDDKTLKQEQDTYDDKASSLENLTFNWKDGKITEIFNEIEDERMVFTYESVKCKGYNPFFTLFWGSVELDVLFLAHPEMAGLVCNDVPVSWKISEISKGTLNCTLNNEGYVVKYVHEYDMDEVPIYHKKEVVELIWK